MSGTANSVNVNLSMNAVTFTQGIKNAQDQLDKFAGKARGAGHSTVSGMQAASASIRLLENPLGNNMRAIERLISQSKTLSAVMKAAFPLVGAIAIGSLIARLGSEVNDFIQKVNKMPKAIEQSFSALALSQKTATDELTLTNDKLDDATNKLNHKPSNAIKIGIDEMTVASDKLAGSITNSNAKLNELLSKNHLSGWSLLLGKLGTSNREGTAKAFSDQADSNAYDLANAAPGSPEQAAAMKALKDTQNAQLAEARRDLATRQRNAKDDDGLPDTANINIDKGVITEILNQQKQQAAEVENARKETENKAAADKKTAAEQAKAAQAAADTQRLKAMEASLNAEKLLRDVSVKDTYDYWTARLGAFNQGSNAYDEVLAKQTAAATESAAKAHENILKFTSSQKRDNSSDEVRLPDLLARNAQDMQRGAVKDAGESNQGYIDSNTLAMEDASNAARQKEAELTDKAGRSMTKYAAAVELAKTHTEEFKVQQSALQAILDIRKSQAAIDPSKENLRGVTAAQAGLANAQTNRNIQVQSDNDAQFGHDSSSVTGFNDAINDFINSTRDAATQMKEITTSSLSSVNAEIVKGLSGQKTNFGNAGAGIFRNIASTGLQKAEGTVLGSLGIGGGGKQGTRSNPMFVKSVDALAPIGNAASGVASSVGGKMGGIFGSLLHMLPGFANGGSVSPGTLAMVGEKGPELAYFGSGASITPNHQLSGMASSYSDGGIHFHPGAIDARGAGDPAQVRFQVMQGIQQATPQIVSLSKQSQKSDTKRTPSTRR